MTTQTFEQLRAMSEVALQRRDLQALRDLARELNALATPEAMAFAENLLGGAALIVGDNHTALSHYRRSLEVYETLNLPDRVATVTGNIGAAYQRIGEHREALDHLVRARNMHATVGDRSGEARVVSNIALVYENTASYDDALKHHHLALEMYEQLGDHHSIARVIGNIGIVYDVLGDVPKALEYYGRARAMHEEHGDAHGLAAVTGNLGLAHSRSGDTATAMEYFYRALEIHERSGDRHGIALITGNLGGIYRSTGDYPSALEYYHRALEISEDLGLRKGVADLTSRIGTVYAMTGAYTQALEHYRRALEIFEEYEDSMSVAATTGNMGDVYFAMGDHALALDHFTRAYELDASVGRQHEATNDLINILHVHVAMGSTQLANDVLAVVDSHELISPEARIAREEARAGIHVSRGEIDDAARILRAALDHAREYALPREQMQLHIALRDLALKRNDLPAYVEHNSASTSIGEEINGKETATKLAMQDVERKLAAERQETAKQLAILHSTLPKHIADRVARGETVNDQHDDAVVLFLDIVGFTTHSSMIDATAVVDHLQRMFASFDALCSTYGVTKIKTIGDSYMAVAFPADDHVRNAADLALALSEQHFTWPHSGDPVEFRIGLHIGPVVAGVLGTERLQYDVWGDTVNVASRMESTGEPGRVHVSEAFASALDPGLRRGDDDVPDSLTSDSLTLFKRGLTDVKGKGPMTTYWLERTSR